MYRFSSTLSLNSALDRGGWSTLYPRERADAPCIGGWLGPRAGLDGCRKLSATRIWLPDRPARSESLYRLRYPGPVL